MINLLLTTKIHESKSQVIYHPRLLYMKVYYRIINTYYFERIYF